MTEAGQIYNFYLIVTPGFEEIAARELRDWQVTVEPVLSRGGIEVALPLSEGLALNRVLKVPTRILMRVADFGCRDFPKLYKKISNLPWMNWIDDSQPVEFHATTKTSRLKMKKRIESTCEDGRKFYLKKRGAPAVKPAEAKTEAQTVFVRFEDDVCFVSLDTSGEILHKRGLRPLSSDAPLRETIAASLLLYLESFGMPKDGVELVDPMTGGGTFLMEAAGLRGPVSSRKFAFDRWVNQTKEVYRAKTVSPYTSFVGFEADAKTRLAAAENLTGAVGDKPLQLIEADFFSASPLPRGKKRWLIANPPYGERIRVEGRLSEYYERLFVAAENVVQPERVLFLLPEKIQPLKLKFPVSWEQVGHIRFSNGGLPVMALVCGRKTST